MQDDEERETCKRFINELKEQGKSYVGYDKSFTVLQNYATTKGLENEETDLLADVIIHTDLGAKKLVSLIKCLIPRCKMSDLTVKSIMTWCLSSVNEIPITVSMIIIQWIIGLWNYQLVDRKVINIYYSVLFYTMLKKERLEIHIARLIYVLTKPEDVSRREVSRLLNFHRKYARPQKHIMALLSLFKSYKPELVPEQIQSVNVESVWRPIPNALQIPLNNARDRAEIQEPQDISSIHLKWNALEVTTRGKSAKPLLPSVAYFQIGSSIFKEKGRKTIFDISSMEDLGKFQLNIELPCNAISVLSNMAGYHLLTYADIQYQSRFSYNLYNTLIRAFILENEKFSVEELNKVLDMTVEFSRYMQQGLLVVNLFFDEYLYFNTGEYQLKLLALLQWMTSISTTELQEKVLVHIQNMFHESTLIMKCEIIKTLKLLITNLFVNQGIEECCQNTPAPFLGQGAMDNLEDVLPILTKASEDLIVSGLNTHSYNILLLSEALSFYEEISILESRSNISSLIVAPPAVIYGSFVTKNCSTLSRICKLLLRYRDTSLRLRRRKLSNVFKNRMNILSMYTQDIVGALLYNKSFSKRENAYFLNNIPNKVIEDLEYCDLDSLLSICNHYAILPYKYTLSSTGLHISTKEDAMSVALCYYPAVNEFLSMFPS